MGFGCAKYSGASPSGHRAKGQRAVLFHFHGYDARCTVQCSTSVPAPAQWYHVIITTTWFKCFLLLFSGLSPFNSGFGSYEERSNFRFFWRKQSKRLLDLIRLFRTISSWSKALLLSFGLSRAVIRKVFMKNQGHNSMIRLKTRVYSWNQEFSRSQENVSNTAGRRDQPHETD